MLSPASVNLTGMGTKVQCKSYLSEYHPIRDLNEDANFSWSPFCEDKAFSGQLCNDFKLRGISSSMDYDREMLKQTMLEQEAIFQKQVCELHRLYRIQKDLMLELKKKQMNSFSGRVDASKSSMFLSQVPPEFGETIWRRPHLPPANTCQNTANITDNDDKRASLNFLKEGATQCSSVSTENGGCVKDGGPLDTKLKTFHRRMLDLRLPADVYIENEDIERTERENVAEPCAAETLNMISGIEAENDVKLTLGNIEVPVFRKGILKSNLHPRNSLSIQSLADLNEPYKNSCEKGPVGSDSHKSIGLNIHAEELQQPWTPMRSKSSFPHRNFFMDKHRSSNYLDTDKVEKGQQWPLLHSDSGQNEIVVNSFSSSLFSEKYPMSSESIKLKLDKARESYLPDQNQTEMWFGEKTTRSIEISGCLDFVKSSHPGCTASQVTSPMSVVYPFSYAIATSPLGVSWRKPSKSIDHIPVAVRALPSFSGSSMLNGQSKTYNAAKQSNSAICDEAQCKGDLQPQMRHGNESSSYGNGLHHGIQMYSTSLTGIHFSASNLKKPNLNDNSDTSYENSKIHEPRKCLRDLQFIDIKSTRDLNLNQRILGGIQDDFTDKQNLARKHDESSKSLMWLREKPSCNGPAECDTLDLRFIKDCSLSPEFLGKEVKDKGSSICVLKHSLSSFDVKDSRIQRCIITDSLNSKGHFNPPDNSCRNFDCSNSVSCDGQLLAYEPKDHGKGKAVGNQRVRDDINLNSKLMPIDDVKLFRISAADETCGPSSLPLTRAAGKLTRNIDLEAPADEMEEDKTFSGVEIVDMNHPVTPIEMSQEKISSHDTCIRLAADTIVSMSVNVHNHLDKVTRYPSPPSSCDLLHLLAEVVTSNAEIAGESNGSRHGICEASDDDGFDVFESMTLKLEELKADEYNCKPCREEKPKDEEKSMASLLLTKPRRGHARKRRQRRDFQKDILPALASLSRYEVTEDLQALGGVTRTGKSRQTSSNRRSTSQNRSSFQPRGGRRPRSLAVTMAEADDNPPKIQPIHTDLENDGGNIMAWGRTTRRCRRQRIPSGHASAPQEE